MSAPIIQTTIALSDITESTTNPRKYFDPDELDELADSIAKKGVLQPVLVRPALAVGRSGPHTYELVAGARRFRASKLAGLDEIPAVIRDMNDAEVLEAQVIENNQRKDVHPIEEADGFAALARDHRHTAETIAAKIGRSKSYVYQRLRLASLSPSARKYCFEGKLSLSGALELVKLPSAELQEQALEDILRRSHGDAEFDVWTIKSVIENNYTLRLADAPFDTKDPAILPTAGACTTCQKRSGAQAEMFADFDKDDRCTDVKCFGAKKEASWALQSAAAREKGLAVLDGEGAKGLFGWSGLINDAFIDLDDVVHDDNDEGKSWRERLGKNSLRVTLARDPAGGVHELVHAVDALEHVRKAKAKDLFALGELTRQVEDAALADDGDEEERESIHAEHRRKRELEDAIVAATTDEIVAAVEKGGIKGKAAWQAFLVAVEDFASEERIAERRGLPTEGLSGPHHRKDPEASLMHRLAASMTDKQVAALVVEILVDTYNFRVRGAFCEALGIDEEAIAARCAKELEQSATKTKVTKRKAVANG
jgi:ParB/RepB/Spo0J family partition protein